MVLRFVNKEIDQNKHFAFGFTFMGPIKQYVHHTVWLWRFYDVVFSDFYDDMLFAFPHRNASLHFVQLA